MTDTRETEHPPATDSALRRVIRQDGWAILQATCLTLVIELGLYALAVHRGLPPSRAVMAVLVASVAWVMMAGPVMAGGSATAIGSLSRAGVLADATAITLIVLCATARTNDGGAVLTVTAAGKIYLTLAAVAVAGAAVVRCARSRAGRTIAGALCAALAALLLAGPFWSGGLTGSSSPAVKRIGVVLTMWCNPLFTVTSATSDTIHFAWSRSTVLYDLTHIGDFMETPTIPWYGGAVFYCLCALGAVAVNLIRGPGRPVEDPPQARDSGPGRPRPPRIR